MSITLNRFANGDTNYVSKHNGNCDTLEGAINAAQSTLATLQATSKFTNLVDCPPNYAGHAGQMVIVKSTEDGLQFASTTAPTTFRSLTDAFASFTGKSLQTIRVNTGETALEPYVAKITTLADCPTSLSGQANKILQVKSDESGFQFSAAAAPSTFVGLSDVPAAYTGAGLKVVRVNSGATALEFAPASDLGATQFIHLTDCPAAYTGQSGKTLVVKSTEDGLQFSAAAAPTHFTGLTDCPASYTGHQYQTVIVNGSETGLMFSTAATPTSFIGLTDVPSAYTGHGSQSVRVNSGATALEFFTPAAVVESFVIALSDEITALTTGTAVVTMRWPYAFTVTAVRASVNTASSSGLPTVDIKKNGTSILSTLITIDASEKTSVTAATPPVISTSSISDDDEITFDITVAGTGTKGLKVTIIGHQ